MCGARHHAVCRHGRPARSRGSPLHLSVVRPVAPSGHFAGVRATHWCEAILATTACHAKRRKCRAHCQAGGHGCWHPWGGAERRRAEAEERKSVVEGKGG